MAIAAALGGCLADFRVLPIYPADALARWDEIAPQLERALAYSFGDVTVDDLHDDAARADCTVWLVNNDPAQGVVITRFAGRRIPCLLVQAVVGDGIENWIDALSKGLDMAAKQSGADRIIFNGRRGWARLIKRYGYTVGHISGFKEI